jgi:peptidase A4-like protein
MSRITMFRGALVTALLALAAAPPAASAANAVSSNWAGYVAHRSGTRFRSVSASWTEPAPVCSGSYPSYSSAWVGLGGFTASSSALEQVGAEADCGPSGQTRSFVWYELVPAPSAMIRMKVKPGDSLKASVTVVGRRVTIRITDLTRRETFSRTVDAPLVDVSSADWIVEAPSACLRNNRTLPLANFGSVEFSGARAQSAKRRRGAIASPLWADTEITLLPSLASHLAFGTAGEATPSPLTRNGSAFDVAYAPAPTLRGAAWVSASLASAGGAPAAPQPGGQRH